MAEPTGPAVDKATAAWADLNDRQRAYLRALYRLDQTAEATERGAWSTGGQARPAELWRWIRYGYVNVGKGAPLGVMQRALDAAGRRDQGAGATLAALAERGLLQQRHDDLDPVVYLMPWYRPETYHVSVQITRTGRAAARAGGADDTRPARTPRGMLSQWLWSVLVQLWDAGDEGVPADRRITAWRHLEDRKDGPYVEHRGGRGLGAGSYLLTDLARQHYRDHWASYARLYPQIAATHPDGAPPWPDDVDRHLRDLGHLSGALAGQLARVLEEHDRLAAPPTPPTSWSTLDGPELAEARDLQAARDQHAAGQARDRLAVLAEHRDRLRDLYRQAAARYTAAAVAVTQAVIDGTDPQTALTAAPPVLLDPTGRPAGLPCPSTGLPGVDDDITEHHRVAVSGPPPPRPTRRRSQPVAPLRADGPARDMTAFAGHLAALVHAGQLSSLRLRARAR